MKITRKSGSSSQHDGGGLGRVVDPAKGRFADLTEEAMTVERDLYDEVKKRGGELLGGAQEQGQKAWKRTSTWIKNNPATAVGTAVGAAVVIGLALTAWLNKSED